MQNKKSVTVIGGGLGGMSAAISLAAEEFKVQLFEKNDHLGGKLNQQTIEGFTFDLGPSILTMPHIFSHLFQMHGRSLDEYLHTKRLDLEWRNFFEDGTVIDLYSQPDDMLHANQALTSQDIRDIKEFLHYAGKINGLIEQGYFVKELETIKEVVKFYGLFKSWFGMDYFSSMADGVKRRIKNPYLQQIYNYFIKYVGSSPYDAPAVLNLLPYIQYKYGLWYTPGGMYKLSEALQSLISELDIEVETGCEVVELKVNDQENNRKNDRENGSSGCCKSQVRRCSH